MTETVEEMVMSVETILNDTDLSKKVVRQILSDFGGMQVYLPRPETAFKDDDHAEIYEAFNGSNGREIVRKYNISFNTMYTILRKEREKRSEVLAKKVTREFDFDK